MYELSKSDRTHEDKGPNLNALISKLSWPAAITAALLVIFFSAMGASNYFTMFAAGEKDKDRALEYVETALAINPENAAAYSMAGRLADIAERPRDAAENYRQSLNYGVIATTTYYNMAKNYEQAGDLEAAYESITEATRIYPQSVYARVHYSILLSKLGKDEEAEAQFATARLINPRQAETWRLVLEEGLLAATDKTRNNKNLDLPYQIRPESIIRVIYAEERRTSQNGLFE